MSDNKKWNLVFYVDDECQQVWKTVKGLTKEQKAVLSSIMLPQAGYCFLWEKASLDCYSITAY